MRQPHVTSASKEEGVLSRREVIRRGLDTVMSYALIRLLATPGVAAQPVRGRLETWLRALDERCRDLKARTLTPTEWQAAVETLLSQVDRGDLLRAIDFTTIERKLTYPDLGVDTGRARFPGLEPPAGLAFHAKVFGMAEDRAIIPHGHRNMVSAHLVIGGRFHLRQFERRGEDDGGLVVEPTVDTMAVAGEASSISDDHNNVHWLIARGGRAHTLDVIISGIDGPGYGIDNLDPERARPLGNGLLRMPTIGVEEALRRYGKDHHA